MADESPQNRMFVEHEAAQRAVEDILEERRRQVAGGGWTPAHDDAHNAGELARAAACYALHGSIHPLTPPTGRWLETWWPWSRGWWKPGSARRDLVKAGALILAEIERLDRQAARMAAPAQT